MKKIILFLLSATIIVAGVYSKGEGDDNVWPQKPVQIIVPAGAGGGTDGTARILAKYLKEKFNINFNVINQGQGGGVIGITSIKSAKPDGYTLGIIYNFAHYKALEQADFSVDDFTVLPQINFDPAGFQVKKDSEWNNLKMALDDVKQNPSDSIIGCGGGCGGSWPMAITILMDAYGIDTSKLKFVPGKGAAAAMQELAAGGFDIVPSSLPEASAMLDAGQVKSLTVMSNKRHPLYPNVPTTKEVIGIDIEAGAFRGVVGPKDMPVEIVKTLDEAISEIYQNPDWQQEMSDRGFGIYFRSSEDFKEYLYDQENKVNKLIDTLGLK